jgi:hypothetical protein
MANSGQASSALNALARLTLRMLRGENPEPMSSFASVERVEAQAVANQRLERLR